MYLLLVYVQAISLSRHRSQDSRAECHDTVEVAQLRGRKNALICLAIHGPLAMAGERPKANIESATYRSTADADKRRVSGWHSPGVTMQHGETRTGGDAACPDKWRLTAVFEKKVRCFRFDCKSAAGVFGRARAEARCFHQTQQLSFRSRCRASLFPRRNIFCRGCPTPAYLP